MAAGLSLVHRPGQAAESESAALDNPVPAAAPAGAADLEARDRGQPSAWRDPYATSAANGRTPYHGRAGIDLAHRDGQADAAAAAALRPPEQRTAEPRAGGDHSELVGRMVAAARVAEGQSVVGSYGASGLTPAMRRLASQLNHGGLAPGSEADSLKSAERLSAKLGRLAARHPDCTSAELAAGIGDAVRYAFAFEPGHYTEGTWLVHRRLKAQGFELEARRNRWDSAEYKGVWTRWRDPAHDLVFEVQFHTFGSWDVIKRTHRAFLLITDPATPPAERARLRARQVAAATAAKAPPDYAEITDFGREAR